jgi:antitoxin component YwqK of YwqJK toxin-antitoxin module
MLQHRFTAVFILVILVTAQQALAEDPGIRVNFHQRIIREYDHDTNRPVSSLEEQYDKNGSLTQKKTFDAKGSVAEKTLYTYSSNGAIASETRYDCFGVLCYVEQFKYDGLGNIIEQNKDLGGFSLNRFINRYDRKGNLIEKIQYITNDMPWYKTQYGYDTNGNRKSEVLYSCTGDICYTENMMYDSGGRLIEQLRSQSGVTISRARYTYDGKGRIIESVLASTNGTFISHTLRKYLVRNTGIEQKSLDASGKVRERTVQSLDNQGNILEETVYDASGLLKNRNTFTYDPMNRLLEADEFDSMEMLLRNRVFEYDDRGNPVKLSWYTYTQVPQTRQDPQNPQDQQGQLRILAHRTTWEYSY